MQRPLSWVASLRVCATSLERKLTGSRRAAFPEEAVSFPYKKPSSFIAEERNERTIV